ncbi:sugar phosphate nucleotidyltransferase [Streptomyces sp. JHA26]|uniref:sugar phosphate nucleotidyltransferase n=1 Tax=Streptomyces sp. JHA26 TaxID=1917143 RepID=UPI001C0DFBCB|nr:sugar phosphate nucleotidyltransferase [Streptomyces sp. JHA26]
MEPLSLVVLAGGRGSRLGRITDSRPKPLVPIGGRPVLWHILRAYEAAGVSRTVIAGGYRVEQVRQAFSGDGTVEVVDTGQHTGTAGRLLRLADRLPDTFCLTYADGLSDVPLSDVIALHRSRRPQATITAVHPPSRFGALALSGSAVTSFEEKTTLQSVWVNGGFMVLDKSVLGLVAGDATSLEQEVLPKLAAGGQLAAYRHEGFWHPMDTTTDVERLNRLWHGGAPWRTW